MDIHSIQNVIGEFGGQSVGDLESEWARRGRARDMFAAMFGGGGGGSSASGGSSFVTSGTLAALLGDIPIANDGDVITADYHNSLRAALLALAAFLGQGAGTQSQVQTYGPALIDEVQADDGSWSFSPQKATASMLVGGWLPVVLPDGVLLKQLAVISTRNEHLKKLNVTLGCASLSDPTAEPIALAEVFAGVGDGTIQTDTASISPRGISSANIIAELSTVDNEAYRYFIEVAADGSEGSEADLYAFQITYAFQ